MTNATDDRPRRSRRRVLLGGALGLVVVYMVGAAVQVPQVQADLRDRVEQVLAERGMEVQAEFSGQDGVLRCSESLTDPAGAVALAESVWGVRSIDMDSSCGTTTGDATAAAGATTVPATTAAPTTAAPTTAAPTTVPASTDVPTTVPPTTVEPQRAVVFNALLADGRVVLAGSVNSDIERLVLVQRASAGAGPSNVVNDLTVDAQTAVVPAEQFAGLLNLLELMPVSLVAGEVGWDGSAVFAVGAYVDDQARIAFGSAAAQVGIAAELTARALATRAQAASLEAELNALVAAEPILFDRGSTAISESSVGTVQRVAGIAKRYGGVAIEVQGHTDSEGDPGRNLVLSEQRATAVMDALVARGVPAADLTATGFGMTQLIFDATGNELPDPSRRVVFGVTVT